MAAAEKSADDLVFGILGGESVLGRRSREPKVLRDRLREGLPYAALEQLLTETHLPQGDVLRVVALPVRTFQRRKKEKLLTTQESDRVYRLARILAIAEDVLGSREKAVRWLTKPSRVLGEAPLGLLDTEIGARDVEDELRRIDYGVIA
jgi:putative toxin-antitoxin system antitoxin component (TIGR02293 family)